MSILLRSLRRVLPALAITVLTSWSALHAQSDYKPHTFAPSWKDQAEDALYNKHDHRSAITLYKKWLEANPRDPSSWYNLACAYALSGSEDRALDALERAVDAGWENAGHATSDPDLASIRSDPRFDAAVKRIDLKKSTDGPSGYVRRFSVMQSVGTYIVALPPDYETSGKEYPICVILHGNGSTELRHGKLADGFGRDGIIYVVPRAPYPNLGVMHSGGDGWTAWTPDQIDAADPLFNMVPLNYVSWIFNCINEVQSNFRAQKGKVFIYGHSQGAYFADLCALLKPEEVASYLAHAGRMPEERFLTADNLQRMKGNGVRAYLVHGREDKVVTPDNTEKLAVALREAGVTHTVKLLEGDHGYSEEIRAAIREWTDSEVRGVGR